VLLPQLVRIVEAYEPMLVVARTEAAERDFDRLVRQEQEEEYARALAQDQAREASEAAEREAEARVRAAEEEVAQNEAAEEEAAERKRAVRAAKASELPAEPPSGPDATRVVVKLPDGRRLDRRFDKGEPLQCVVDLIECNDVDIYDFDLVSNYPRKVFGREHRGQSLEQLGLHPAATLFTKEQDDEDE